MQRNFLLPNLRNEPLSPSKVKNNISLTRERQSAYSDKLKLSEYEKNKIRLGNISELLETINKGKKAYRHKTVSHTNKHQDKSQSRKKTKNKTNKKQRNHQNNLKLKKKMSNIEMCQENMIMYDMLRIGESQKYFESQHLRFKRSESKRSNHQEEIGIEKIKTRTVKNLDYKNKNNKTERVKLQKDRSYEFQNLKIKKIESLKAERVNSSNDSQVENKVSKALKCETFRKTRMAKKKYKDLSIKQIICDEEEEDVNNSVEKSITKMRIRAVTQSKIDYNNEIGECW